MVYYLLLASACTTARTTATYVNHCPPLPPSCRTHLQFRQNNRPRPSPTHLRPPRPSADGPNHQHKGEPAAFRTPTSAAVADGAVVADAAAVADGAVVADAAAVADGAVVADEAVVCRLLTGGRGSVVPSGTIQPPSSLRWKSADLLPGVSRRIARERVNAFVSGHLFLALHRRTQQCRPVLDSAGFLGVVVKLVAGRQVGCIGIDATEQERQHRLSGCLLITSEYIAS